MTATILTPTAGDVSVRSWAKDAGERVLATGIEAAVGIFATSTIIDIDTVHKALLAAAIASAALIKTYAAAFLNRGTPAGLVNLK